jgi:hypothetical protein
MSVEAITGLLEFCHGCEPQIEVDGVVLGFLCRRLNVLMTWHTEENRWIFLTNFSEKDLVALVKTELEKFN